MGYKYLCSVALLLAGVLTRSAEATCSRRYSSPQPDCSTARRPGAGTLSDTYIPCFTVSPEDGVPQQLEFPDDNTQTCYRTCIDSGLQICEATLVSNVHNKDLVVGVDFKLSVFSQGFQRVTNQKYRKSSICRYSVKCPEGQILSYSMDFHKLEEPTSCGTSGMSCLDSLTLVFPGMASSATSCGTHHVSSTNSDGSSELFIEFMSNRQRELNGFMLLAWCVDPTLRETETTETPSQEKRGAEENRAESRRCTSAGWGRENANARRNESASLQILADAFTSHSRKILHPGAVHITVDVFNHVSYQNQTIIITQRNGTVTEFPGINKFHLSNRLVNDSVFRFSAPGHYHGYGYIVMWHHQAFFLQDGINPEYRPTEEEQTLIKEFKIGLREAAKTILEEKEEGGSGGEVEEGSGEGDIWEGKRQKPSPVPTATQRPSSERPSWSASETPSPSAWTPTTEKTTDTPSTWTEPLPETTETPSTWTKPTDTPSTWTEPTDTPSTWTEPLPETTETPSTWTETTETPSTWTETTETPSTWTETDTPSTWTETTDTPSTWTETPSTWHTPSPSTPGWADTEKPTPTWASNPLVTKAWRYSTACNALLRSTACAYLKLVAGKNCPSVPGSWEQ